MKLKKNNHLLYLTLVSLFLVWFIAAFLIFPNVNIVYHKMCIRDSSYGTEYYDKNFEHNTFATPIFDMIAPLNPADELSVIETDATTLAIEYSVKLIYATDQTEFDKIKTCLLYTSRCV